MPKRPLSLLPPLALVALLVWPVASAAVAAFAAETGEPLSLSAALWLHTALIALVAVGVATALGVTIALWAVHIRTPWLRGALILAGAFPLVVPMYLHGMAAWQMAVQLGLYQELSATGPWTDLLVVGLVQGLRLSACVHLLVVAGWQTLHGRWLEAGLLVAPRGWVHRHITLPLLLPFIGLGALLAAVISVTDVSVPLLFQVRSVLALRLWDAHYRMLDPAASWRAMLGPALATVVAVALLLPPLWRRAAPLLTARRDPAAIPRGGTWPLAAGGAAALILSNGSLLHLLRQVTSLSVLIETFQANTALIAASLEIAVGSTAVALIVGLILAKGISDRHLTAGLTLAVLLFAVPGFLWAASAVTWWNQPGWRGAVHDTGLVRWLVLGGRLIALPAILLALALARQSPRQREAAELACLTRWQTWREVIWPPLRRPLWVAFALCALVVLGDLDAAILMDMPGRTTLVVGLCNRLHISPRAPEVAMMAVVILTTAMALLVIPVVVSIGGRKLRVTP